MYPWMMYPMMMPKINPIDLRPMTLYSLLNSIVNFGKEEKTNIYELSKKGRSVIFDFDYPLSNTVSKEKFETMILNHYMMRRIGFETPTQFKLQLNVKLNEIMPIYNKLFDSIENWNLFNDGEIQTREISSNNSLSSNSSTNTLSDRRYSELPQNELSNISSGTYMTDYNLDHNTGTDTSSSKGNSITNEIMKKSPSDKIKLFKEYTESVNSIYSMIFKELDILFYSLD